MFSLDYLVLLGAFLLALSLGPALLIIRRLPTGTNRWYWLLLSALILIFFIGYLLYYFLHSDNTVFIVKVLVPVIFAGGGFFVFLIIQLSFQTLKTVLRIELLEKETVTDPLTGLFNRRFLERRLKEEFIEAKRYGLKLSIIMFDIDYFKKFNDEYGHHRADGLLVKLGNILNSVTRESDISVRYGGDEMVIICSNTDLDAAHTLAQRIRDEASRVRCDEDGEELCCTLSIGIAQMNAKMHEPSDLVEAADKVLYRAKAEGRDRICLDGG